MRSCPICRGTFLSRNFNCIVKPYIGKTQHGFQCDNCGFIGFPENNQSYDFQLQSSETESNYKTLRNGNNVRPGREYYMAKMCLNFFTKADKDITFFGSGLNTDYKWIVNEFTKTRTKLVDLTNTQNAINFETISNASKSDIIVACEVIEHFANPFADFSNLFRILKSDGILVCSTNIYDGTDISKHQYPFVPGHCSYWSPKSLVTIAKQFNLFIDFRSPKISIKRAGPRKKYIFFYKDPLLCYEINQFFATNIFALSEE